MKIRRFSKSNETPEGMRPLSKDDIEDIFIPLSDIHLVTVKIEEFNTLFKIKLCTNLGDDWGWQPMEDLGKKVSNIAKHHADVYNQLSGIIESLNRRSILFQMSIKSALHTDVAGKSNTNEYIGVISNSTGFFIDFVIWKTPEII